MVLVAQPGQGGQGALATTTAATSPASPAQQQRTASPGVNNTSAASNEGRKISCEDIQLVQNLIERCLQLYMNQVEVINTLKYQAKIEPGFTSLVWQKLEEQNPDFFKAYYTRLKVKRQITLFNHFLEQQVRLLQKMRMIPQAPSVMMQPMPNVHHMPLGYAMSAGPPNSVQPHMGGVPMQVPNAHLMNGGSPVQEYSESQESPGGTAVFPFSNMENPTDSNNMGNPTDSTGMQMGLDPGLISNDPGQNGIGSLSMSPTEADSSSARESLESLGQIPRNFSLSDLTAELSNSQDLGELGNYTGSPFLNPDTEAFLQSPDKEFIGLSDEEKMLDSVDDPLHIDFGDSKS